VHRLQFHYTLSNDSSPAQVRNPLIDLLQAVAQAGSISAAARAMKLSYRHVWGELKRWETVLGHELIVWEKGRSARLTEFADKLMWAEAQAQARLAPQIEALRSELERTFAVAFDDSAHVVTLYASHDDALSRLREHALQLVNQHRGGQETRHGGPLHLDIRFCGSLDAIRALNEGRCVMAGFHTQQHPAVGSLAERTYKPLLQPGLHKIIGFAERTQGLMVAPGNPLALMNLPDVARSGARFVNRALGTGTRVLLDELLAQAGLQADNLKGYAQTEPSHTAVAQTIASGAADAGLGIEQAARSKGLDFVPLLQENYHLVCLKSALDQPAIAALRHLLQAQAWQQTLAGMAGYVPSNSGEVLALSQVLPWWRFGKKNSL
jgi:putative molybdopterin biosynthesis protein